MTFSPRAIEAATQRAYEKFNENLIGCCEPTWSELTGDVKQRLRDSIEAALTAALAVDGVVLQGWRTIESAPKDGTRILWSCGDDKMSVIHWPEYDLCFEGGYWMPLPKPPAASDREERR